MTIWLLVEEIHILRCDNCPRSISPNKLGHHHFFGHFLVSSKGMFRDSKPIAQFVAKLRLDKNCIIYIIRFQVRMSDFTTLYGWLLKIKHKMALSKWRPRLSFPHVCKLFPQLVRLVTPRVEQVLVVLLPGAPKAECSQSKARCDNCPSAI